MNAFPSERFKRTVVRDKLDLAGKFRFIFISFLLFILNQFPYFCFLIFLVSIGGSVGLFVGASILSVVEIFYYFGMRLWEKTAEDEPNEQYLRY